MPETKDDIVAKRSLDRLPKLPASLMGVPKIVFLSPGQSKINHRCPKAKMSVVITLHSTSARQFNSSVIDEYVCDCGTIFRKT